MKIHKMTLFRAILAGLIVGVAGTVYLSLKDKSYALSMFSFGVALLLIVSQGYNLYTGKVGYLLVKPLSYVFDIFLIIIGNFIGLFIYVIFLRLGGYVELVQMADALLDVKLSHTYTEVFFRAIFCGFLMYLAIDGYLKNDNIVAKVAVVFFAVVIFIGSQYDHSIANLFYITLAWKWSWGNFLYFLVMVLGNGVGAIMINTLERFAFHNEKHQH